MDEVSKGIEQLSHGISRELLGGSKEVPSGRQPQVVVAIVIPVVVDVHATLVDIEFGVVVVGERYVAHSRP